MAGIAPRPGVSAMMTVPTLMYLAGLPKPEHEYRFAPPRRWRFDFAWPEDLLAVEIEGGIWNRGRHVRPRGYEKDCEKYNAAALAGWRVFRVTTPMLRDGRALALFQQLREQRKGYHELRSERTDA